MNKMCVKGNVGHINKYENKTAMLGIGMHVCIAWAMLAVFARSCVECFGTKRFLVR